MGGFSLALWFYPARNLVIVCIDCLIREGLCCELSQSVAQGHQRVGEAGAIGNSNIQEDQAKEEKGARGRRPFK